MPRSLQLLPRGRTHSAVKSRPHGATQRRTATQNPLRPLQLLFPRHDPLPVLLLSHSPAFPPSFSSLRLGTRPTFQLPQSPLRPSLHRARTRKENPPRPASGYRRRDTEAEDSGAVELEIGRGRRSAAGGRGGELHLSPISRIQCFCLEMRTDSWHAPRVPHPDAPPFPLTQRGITGSSSSGSVPVRKGSPKRTAFENIPRSKPLESPLGVPQSS